MNSRKLLAGSAIILTPLVSTVHADLTLSANLSFVEEGGTIGAGNFATSGTAFAKDVILGGTLPAHSTAFVNNGTFGNCYTGAGRVLPTGIMALATRCRPQSSPEDPFSPRVLVMRDSVNSLLSLPALPAVNGRPSTLSENLYFGSIIPIANGRILFGAAAKPLVSDSSKAFESPLGNGPSEHSTYASIVEITEP